MIHGMTKLISSNGRFPRCNFCKLMVDRVRKQEIPVRPEIQPMNDKNGLCPFYSRKVTYGLKVVESKRC